MNGKNLVITEVDFDRLNALAASRQGRVAYGATVDHLREELGRGKIVPPQRVSATWSP